MAVGLTHNGPSVRSENKWANHSWVQPTVLVSLVQGSFNLKNNQLQQIFPWVGDGDWYLLLRS
jgi:hypothetical protein